MIVAQNECAPNPQFVEMGVDQYSWPQMTMGNIVPFSD